MNNSGSNNIVNTHIMVSRVDNSGNNVYWMISKALYNANALVAALNTVLGTEAGKELISFNQAPTGDPFDPYHQTNVFWIEPMPFVGTDTHVRPVNAVDLDGEPIAGKKQWVLYVNSSDLKLNEDLGGISYFDQFGKPRPFGLERLLAHELRHTTSNDVDPEQSYPITNEDEFRAFLADPEADVQGNTVRFADQVMSEIDQSIRTHYVNSAMDPGLKDLDVSIYFESSDQIARTKIGAQKSEWDEVIRTDYGNSSDLLIGMGGNDELYAGEGRDFLFGMSGDDILDGGNGDNGDAPDGEQDVLAGGEGDDVYKIAYVLGTNQTGALTIENMEFEGTKLVVTEVDLTKFEDVDLVHDQDGSGVIISKKNGASEEAIGHRTFLKIRNADNETQYDVYVGLDGHNLIIDGSTAYYTIEGSDYVNGPNGLIISSYPVVKIKDFTNGDLGIDLLDETFPYDGWIGDEWYEGDFSLLKKFDVDYLDSGDNSSQGGGGDDAVYGLGGDDSLSGGFGDDRLFGGAGDDILNGNQGADTLAGGAGDDIIYVDADDLSYDGGIGNDTIIFTQASDVSYAVAQYNFEHATGGAGNDTFWGTGSINILNGGAGNDGLHGYGGDDILTGGAGADYMIGGEGDDTIYVDQDDTWYSGDEGIDTVVYQGTGNFEYSLNQGEFENAVGGTGDDSLWGGDVQNNLQGGAGNDSLFGYGGADTFNGNSGDDYIVTGEGDDTIRIEGNSFGHDTIADFTAGLGSEDKIVLDNAVFADFSDVLSKAEDWGGDNTYITLDDDNSITLYGIKKADLHADDFQFV
ncbi:calcium-binding protein [Pseudovibrio ascidiaceicola]|uniref:calcium-binding protein n=1 Tax=Pseudovibrio ascidiaceicola TaxID=285279 RepID=UPI003D3692B2